MENIYESVPGPDNFPSLGHHHHDSATTKPPLPPRTIFQGFDKSEKRAGEKSTASSVVMALIRFYDKSRARVPAAALTANPVRNNEEDTVSARHRIPASDTDQRELKINCGKIVSGGTNVTNFGVAPGTISILVPGSRILNTSSRKIENFHHNFQDGNVLLKKKNNSSALKISGSIKNNSMDEFLLLVKKTKQKYRDLLEKDFEKQRRNESFKKMKNESHQNNNLDVQAKNNLHSQKLSESSSEVRIKLNRQTSILLENTVKDGFKIRKHVNNDVSEESGLKLKTEIRDLQKRCEELKDAKLKAENELNNVHLMSWDQLEKLQNLELKQDFLEDENHKMIHNFNQVEKKNSDLKQNITNLESQVEMLKKVNKSFNIELSEKENQLENEIRNQEHWKSEYEIIIQSCHKKQLLIEKLEFELVELENIIQDYEAKIAYLCRESSENEKRLVKENEKLKWEYQNDISNIQEKIQLISKERDNMKQKNETLERTIDELESRNKFLQMDLKAKIVKTKSSLEVIQDESHSAIERNIYIRKLKHQLEDSENERKSLKSKNKIISDEKYDLENMLSKCSKSKDNLNDRYMEKNKENLALTGLLKENEEELKVILKKYQTSVSALSSQQVVLDQQFQIIGSLENENEQLEQKIKSLEYEAANARNDKETVEEIRMKMKISHLESNLEYEEANTSRLRLFLERAKSNMAASEVECASLLKKNEILSCNTKNLERQLKMLKGDFIRLQINENKASNKTKLTEHKLKVLDAENSALKSQNQQANQRLENLQLALFLELDSDLEMNFSSGFGGNVKLRMDSLEVESEC